LSAPSEQSLHLAEEFLREAVYRSRERQAIGVSLQPTRPDGSSPTNCGLGRGAEVVLDLSARARGILRELWPEELAQQELERLRAVMTDWIETQDALDRQRNHFMRDYRKQHGFDRSLYTPEQVRDFEAGLERVNAEESSKRRAQAQRLLVP